MMRSNQPPQLPLPAPGVKWRPGSERKPFHDDVTRSIRAVSLGMQRQVDKRDARKRELGLRETLQMFQVQVAGEAGTSLAWNAVACEFDYRFYYSPGSVDSELEVPNFMFGAVELNAPVLVTAYVIDWTRDPDNEAVIGASVNVGAVAPDTDHAIGYAGKLHLTFAGWASLYEDETEVTE